MKKEITLDREANHNRNRSIQSNMVLNKSIDTENLNSPKSEEKLQTLEDGLKKTYLKEPHDRDKSFSLLNYEDPNQLNLSFEQKEQLQRASVNMFVNSETDNKRKHTHKKYQMETPMFIEIADQFKIPPSFEEAENYAKSLQVAEPKPPLDQNPICPYTGRYIQRQSIDYIQCEPESLDFLGTAYPLFFDYIKYCIFMLLTLFLTAGVYNLFSNIMLGKDCYDEKVVKDMIAANPALDPDSICIKNWSTMGSLANKRTNEDLMELQEVINIFSVFVMIIMFQFLRKSQREMEVICEAQNECEDYTLMVKKIPTTIYQSTTPVPHKKSIIRLQKELSDFFYDNFGQKPVDISIVFNIQQIENVIHQQQKAIQKYQQEIQYYVKNDYQIRDENEILKIYQEIEKHTKQYHEISEQFHRLDDQIFHSSLSPKTAADDKDLAQSFLGIAFVSFNRITDVKEILQKLEPVVVKEGKFFGLIGQETTLFKPTMDQYVHDESKKVFQVKPKELQIQSTEHPEEIYWDNLRFGKSELMTKQIQGWLIDIGVQIFCILFQIGLKLFHAWYQGLIQGDDHDHGSGSSGSHSWSHSGSGSGSGSDSGSGSHDHGLFSSILHFLSKFITLKYWIGIIVAFLVSYFVQSLNEYIMEIKDWAEKFSSGPVKSSQAIYKDRGLIDSQHNVALTLSCVNNIQYLLDVKKFRKNMQKKWKMRDKKNCVLTQEELNRLHQNENFDISQRYAQMTAIMYSAAFYSPIIPIVLVYYSLNLVVLYFIEKYKLLNDRIVKNRCNAELPKFMTEMLELMLPIYCFSNALFEVLIKSSNGETVSFSWFSTIGFFLGFIHMYLPMEIVNEYLFHVPQPHQDENRTYHDEEKNFDSDYRRANPAIKDYEQKQYTKQFLVQAQNILG